MQFLDVSERTKKPLTQVYLTRKFVGDKAKGRISKRFYKQTKHIKYSEKRTFLIPWNAHARTWG